MNKDNQIMNLLSDIDEELIDDILEIPQSSESSIRAIKASNKSIFAKFALPIAACIAVAASVTVLVQSGKNGAEPIDNENARHFSKPFLSEVSEEDRTECERLIADDMDYNMAVRTGYVYSCAGIDLDFDGSDEIALFPIKGFGSIYYFDKAEDNYFLAGITDLNGPYYLNNLEDLLLYDKNGEKYYYYYYLRYRDYYEEKGVASLKLEDNGVKSESLLSYGGYLGGMPDEAVTNFISDYYKNGDSYINYEEFCRLWAEYDGLPPIIYEEYWGYDSGTPTLDNAPMLSDLIKENALPDIYGSYMFGTLSSTCYNYEGTVPKAVLCRKECGEYTLSLIGYKLRTDSHHFESNSLIIHKWCLVLSDKNGNIVGANRIGSPFGLSLTEDDFSLDLDYITDCLEIVDFDGNQVVLFRVGENELYNSVHPFAVRDGRLYRCEREDKAKGDRYWSILLSGSYAAETTGSEEFPCYNIKDNVSKEIFTFNFSFENGVYYICSDIDILPEYGGETVDISEYAPVDDIDIPVLDMSGLDFRRKAETVLEKSVPKVVFASDTVSAGKSDYTLYLIGKNVRYEKEENGVNAQRDLVCCNDIKTAVFKDGVYLGSVVNESRGYHYGYLDIETYSYDRYSAKGYYCPEYDCLLLLRLDPERTGWDDLGSDRFAAVKEGKLYPDLSGYIDNRRPKPEWAEKLRENEFPDNSDITVNGNVLTCGWFDYRFNFGEHSFGMEQYDFEVLWREEKPQR